MTSRFNPARGERWILQGVGVGIVLSIIVPMAVRQWRDWSLPRIDENGCAYVCLVQGNRQPEYAVAKAVFDRAYALATDPELQSLALFFSCACQAKIDSGVAILPNGRAVTHIRSLSGMEGGLLISRPECSERQNDCRIVDQKYQARTARYLEALDLRDGTSRFYWWMILVVPAIFIACGGRRLHATPNEMLSARVDRWV